MVTSSSRLSYQDCYELMDRAMSLGEGIRFPVRDRGAAHQFRVRLHTARQINRNDNSRDYEPGDPLYGVSEYDQLVVKVREEGDKVYVYIVKMSNDLLEIEELNGINQSSLSDSGPLSLDGATAKVQKEVEKIIGPISTLNDRRD